MQSNNFKSNSLVTLDLQKSHRVNCRISVDRGEYEKLIARYKDQASVRPMFSSDYAIAVHWARRKYNTGLYQTFSDVDKANSDLEAASLQAKAIALGLQKGIIAA